MSVGEKLCGWSAYDIVEAEAKYRVSEGDFPDYDVAFAAACEDQDLHDCEWEYLMEHITEILNEKNPDLPWYVEMRNFGWREQGGHNVFGFETGEDLVRQVLPKTDCTFDIYAYGENGLALNNFHHDSPVGKEWYYLTPLEDSECPACGETFLDLENQHERDSIRDQGMCLWCKNEEENREWEEGEEN